MKISQLQLAIQTHGYAKIAYEVLRERGEYVPRDGSVQEHVMSLSLKIAQNQIAHRKIRRGLEAYARVMESK